MNYRDQGLQCSPKEENSPQRNKIGLKLQNAESIVPNYIYE